MENLISWFKSKNGELDSSYMTLADIPGQGRGAIALKDIPENHTLFSIPRDITLSTRTSTLPTLFGESPWEEYGLNNGWVGLILCMLWEEAQGESSKWSGYLASLPFSFDTPMFWSDEDLQELRGTSVVGKIGKDEAERDYKEKLVPAIQSRPDLFPRKSIPLHYTVEKYHIMGSRILSRSFQVEPWNPEEQAEESDEEDRGDAEEDEENNPDATANTSLGSAMDVDEPEVGGDPVLNDEEELDIGDEDEEDDSAANVAMVPMADMLNARFESENAKLFHEENVLKMVTTKSIKAGEQIWNTYGDLPNSDLLRRYGHVDLLPLPEPLEGEGNPADVVEIRADLVMEVVSKKRKGSNLQERVDWWLEDTEDDTFIIGIDCKIPKELLSLAQLLLLPVPEWEKAVKKGKQRKAKLDAELLPIVIDVLKKRLKEYPTTLKSDEKTLQNPGQLSLNKKNAIIIRVGEKRILDGTLRSLQALGRSRRSEERKHKNDLGSDRTSKRTRK